MADRSEKSKGCTAMADIVLLLSGGFFLYQRQVVKVRQTILCDRVAQIGIVNLVGKAVGMLRWLSGVREKGGTREKKGVGPLFPYRYSPMCL